MESTPPKPHRWRDSRWIRGKPIPEPQRSYYALVLIAFGLGFAILSLHTPPPPPQQTVLPLLMISPSVLAGVFMAGLATVVIAERARHAKKRRARRLFIVAVVTCYAAMAVLLVAGYTPPLVWTDVASVALSFAAVSLVIAGLWTEDAASRILVGR